MSPTCLTCGSLCLHLHLLLYFWDSFFSFFSLDFLFVSVTFALSQFFFYNGFFIIFSFVSFFFKRAFLVTDEVFFVELFGDMLQDGSHNQPQKTPTNSSFLRLLFFSLSSFFLISFFFTVFSSLFSFLPGVMSHKQFNYE